MNENDPLKNEGLEGTENTDLHAVSDAVSGNGDAKKSSQKPWVALAFFAVSAAALVAAIIKFFHQYNIEKKAYDILVESGLPQKIIDAMTEGKTPVNYAVDALLKSQLPYIAVIALIIGFIWLGIRRHK